MTFKKRTKTRLHFNRINMQRGDSRVWTAHNCRGCFQAEKLVIMHNGVIMAETIFRPTAQQPRAYFSAVGQVRYDGSTAIIDVSERLEV